MPHANAVKTLSIVALASFALAACAGIEPRYPITAQVPPEKGLIQFNDPLLANARQVRVSHLSSYEHVDYARYETDDVILEAVYDVALNVSLVLEYDYWMARMTDTWNANNGQPKSWGTVQNVTAWHGGITYQPYRLTASGQDCAAFSSEWDYQPRDSKGRPSRVFFGYICAKPGMPLTDQAVASLLKSVTFPRTSVERLVPLNPRRSVDQAAFAAAKGGNGSRTGNAMFPFNFGRTYFDGNGDTSFSS